jgi:hypothetical protein
LGCGQSIDPLRDAFPLCAPLPLLPLPPVDNDDRGDGNDGVTVPLLPDNDRMFPAPKNGNDADVGVAEISTLNDWDRVGAGVVQLGVELADDVDVRLRGAGATNGIRWILLLIGISSSLL